METILGELHGRTHLPFAVIATRLVVALVLGAAIGFEREWRNQPAGLRTHIMVCLATALLAILGIEITHLPVFDDKQVQVDPLRLLESVTAGVAFLAAGLLIVSQGKVRGLTTAAGLWLAGVVGLAAGLGFSAVAALACAMALVVLALFRFLPGATRHEGGTAPRDTPSSDDD